MNLAGKAEVLMISSHFGQHFDTVRGRFLFELYWSWWSKSGGGV